MELCLGTVQFGMDYGIIGQKKPSLEDAVCCLDYAVQNGISAIDTAEAYGTAEEVVGAFLKRRTVPRRQLFLSTKLLPNCLDGRELSTYASVIQEKLEGSLRTLHTDYVDALLLHSSRYAFEPEILDALYTVKEKGLARKVGVSVYEPEEAFACFENKKMELIQAPYSVFDHRMKERGVLDGEKNQNCRIHTRSAFIQGLVTLKEEEVPRFLWKAKPIIRRMDEICRETGFGRVALAMAYVKREKGISHLVFGVDSLQQLKEDIRFFQEEVPLDILEALEKEFQGLDAGIVIPSLWKKETR